MENKKLNARITVIICFLFHFFSNSIYCQTDFFIKKISNYVPEGLIRNVHNDLVVWGRDSTNNYLLLIQVQNGKIGWSFKLNDTVSFEPNISKINTIRILTRRKTFVAMQEISGFSMGGFFNFRTLIYEFDTLGNIIWNINLPIYQICNMYENDDGSYDFLGGLDFSGNSAEAIYGKIDTAGHLLNMYKMSPNTQIRGFDQAIKTLDGGYFTLGRKYNGNNFESVIMKFDSSMNTQFVKRINFGMDAYCTSSVQLKDSTYIFFINTPTDSSYVVKLNSSGISAKALRITTPLNIILNCVGSTVLLSYNMNNNTTGVLKIDQDLNYMNNYSIIDSAYHAFFMDSKIIENKFNALFSNGKDCWFIELDSLVSASCYFYPSTISIDTINLSLTDDSISGDPYGSASLETPYGIYFTNTFPEWSDSCFTIINKIDEFVDENPVKLFPNPTNNFLFLRIKNKEKYKLINVFNLFGQKQELKYNAIENKEYIELNTSSLSPGIYFLELLKDNQRVIKRFIKV